MIISPAMIERIQKREYVRVNLRTTPHSSEKTNQLKFYREGNVFFAFSGRKLVFSEYTFSTHFRGDFRRGYLQQIDGSHEPSRSILRASGNLNPHGGWYTVAFSEKGRPFASFRNHLGIKRKEAF